jgi:hypothetical protein
MTLLRVLSLGAGVQSTTLALMAAAGELPLPDCAIFADTGWEPAAVYAHLDWLEGVLPFPVHRVQRANLRHEVLANMRGEQALAGVQRATIPAWTATRDGKATPIHRTCTLRYKVQPIVQKVAELAGVETGRAAPRRIVAESWIGISTDEASRMKPSQERWIAHRWPLIDAGLSRADCLRWFERRYPERQLRKSACIGCPYHSDIVWRELRDNHPAEWADACELDAAIRPGMPGMTGTAFLHRSLVPLREADLRNWSERGQPDLFGNECEGMCGT